MLLLLATCYCCIIDQLLWFMYRGLFTVGVALIDDQPFASAIALTDYSYITTSGSSRMLLARCLTGLGPNEARVSANEVLGGWYFKGTKIPNGPQCTRAGAIIQPIPGASVAGLIVLNQCRQFTTDTEGVYTCTISNSSMMDQSVRLGIYLNGRSESLDLFIPSFNHLSSLYTATPVINPMPPNTMTVNVGDPLMLSCTSRGSPPDTFTWRKDSGLVLQSTTNQMTYNTNSAVFRADYSIASVTTSDSGTYTCTVTNPIGSDTATITVASKLFIRSMTL